jgi:hypothetical protein
MFADSSTGSGMCLSYGRAFLSSTLYFTGNMLVNYFSQLVVSPEVCTFR